MPEKIGHGPGPNFSHRWVSWDVTFGDPSPQTDPHPGDDFGSPVATGGSPVQDGAPETERARVNRWCVRAFITSITHNMVFVGDISN